MNITDFIIMGFLILAVISAYLVIRLPHKYWLKWFLVPILIAFGFFLYTEIPNLLGFPKLAFPTQRFQLLDFGSFVLNKDTKVIEFWVMEDGSNDTRLYEVPYSDQTNQQLGQLAAAEKKNGSGVRGQFQSKTKNNDTKANMGNNTQGTDKQLNIIKIPPEPLPNKNAR